MPRELPQFYMFSSSHGNIYIFLFYKTRNKGEEMKRELVLVSLRFLYSCGILRFRNTLGLMP